METNKITTLKKHLHHQNGANCAQGTAASFTTVKTYKQPVYQQKNGQRKCHYIYIYKYIHIYNTRVNIYL